MRAGTTMIEAPAAGRFVPLSAVLASTPPDRLDEARRRVANLSRSTLLDRFGGAFADDKRLGAFLFAEELTKRGIPPAFRGTPQPANCLNKRYDLLVYDLRWLRWQYSEHLRVVRYRRCKKLLSFGETDFHREAEYAFYEGRRPAWKLVGSLSLTEQQQWDCFWLRSVPITRRHIQTEAMRTRILAGLRDDLQKARRTAAFTERDAEATLQRRLNLWVCSRMTDGSPSETARRYHQMTGQLITRQVTAKQLEKVRTVLRKRDALATWNRDETAPRTVFSGT